MHDGSWQIYLLKNFFFASVVLPRRKIFEALEKI